MAVKGIEELYKTYIYLALTLVFIVFAAQPLYGSVEFARRNNARLLAEEISGVINRAQSSPADITYEVRLVKECEISVTEKFVRVAFKNQQDAVSNVIQTDVNIVPAGINCENYRTIVVTKQGNRIEISGVR